MNVRIQIGRRAIESKDRKQGSEPRHGEAGEIVATAGTYKRTYLTIYMIDWLEDGSAEQRASFLKVAMPLSRLWISPWVGKW